MGERNPKEAHHSQDVEQKEYQTREPEIAQKSSALKSQGGRKGNGDNNGSKAR